MILGILGIGECWWTGFIELGDEGLGGTVECIFKVVPSLSSFENRKKNTDRQKLKVIINTHN